MFILPRFPVVLLWFGTCAFRVRHQGALEFVGNHMDLAQCALSETQEDQIRAVCDGKIFWMPKDRDQMRARFLPSVCLEINCFEENHVQVNLEICIHCTDEIAKQNRAAEVDKCKRDEIAARQEACGKCFQVCQAITCSTSVAALCDLHGDYKQAFLDHPPAAFLEPPPEFRVTVETNFIRDRDFQSHVQWQFAHTLAVNASEGFWMTSGECQDPEAYVEGCKDGKFLAWEFDESQMSDASTMSPTAKRAKTEGIDNDCFVELEGILRQSCEDWCRIHK